MRVTAAVVDELGGPFRIEELDLDEPGPAEALDDSPRGEVRKPVLRMKH